MRLHFSWLALILVGPTLAPQGLVAQTALSANSGINSSDTWVTMDVTISGTDTATFSSPVALLPGQTPSNTVTLSPPALTMHVEAGYDASGGLVINVWPTGTTPYAMAAGGSLGMIRFAGGQMTVFDQNGNPLPVNLPSTGASANWPLSLLGSNPGPSVVRALVVPNIQSRATALSASLSLSTNLAGASVAALNVPVSSGNTANWSYVQSGSYWIAQSLTIPAALPSVTSSQTIQFANLNWNENATNDAARAAAGSTVQALPSPVTTAPGPLPTPEANPAPAATGASIDVTNCNTNVYPLGGPQNVAFIHGLASSSCAWGEMANWLDNDGFRFGTEVLPSLDGDDGVAAEGQGLINEINSVGGTNYILIGHSMGGLAARYAAQYFQNEQAITQQPSPVYGVVTVDTPHQGAPAAAVLQPVTTIALAAAGAYLWSYLGCGSSGDNWGCFFAAVLTGASPLLAGETWSSISGSLTDLSPGSAALNNLNNYALTGGTPENFQQAAIIGQTPWQWSEARWGWEWIVANILNCDGPNYCCDPDTSWCGENAVATGIGAFWDALAIDLLILELEQWGWCDYTVDPTCQPPPVFQDGIDKLISIIVWMAVPDLAWNIAVNGSLDFASDALVPVSNQQYPATNARNYHLSSDSHSGALRSTTDHAALDSILLSTQFNVPTQASCTFTLPTSQDTVSGSGGTGNFSVTTGGGCNWNVSSQWSWISVTSAGNGTSSGTVSFSVLPNPSTVPRVGAIQVGNGTSSALFTVNEGGNQALCTYRLSEGSVVASPPAGETNTVQVTTGQDCPWSAVSNSNWITVVSGSIGTGPGSFTWTAAANTSAGDRSGTITVMNQTLTVVDGSPVGTPGAGWVTINGSEEDLYGTLCAYYCLPVTLPQIGSITVTVGGETFYAAEYGSSTASQLAASLASAINSTALSPVSATASGATVQLTSTLNGSATNYPLSASYTYTQCYDIDNSNLCFSSAAFTTATSGAYLTGGTD